VERQGKGINVTMADIFTKEKRSLVMSKITSKNTKLELHVFKYLRKNKIYFQKHYKKAPGKPDIAIPSRKIAVLIDGDFWHGWRFKEWRDKLPSIYWIPKIESNIKRDRRNIALLKKQGWKVLRVWEHDLVPKKRERTLHKIAEFLKNKDA
jgi:DNA mismatch endonuclease (patch repair protein)